MKKLSTLFILILLLISSLSAESAKTILDKMEDAMEFETLSFSATIKNTDRMGTTTQSFDAVQNDDGDTLLTVTSGMDKGQKVLRLDDEIYIYYPDADEIIRLSDSGLSSSFLGSDFSYEDLSGDDDYEDRYNYELVGEETFNNTSCYRIKFSAKKLSETYQKMEMLIDKVRYVPIVEELYSKSGRLLKTIYYDGYSERPYFPTSVKTENSVKKSNKSEMNVKNIVFNKKIDSSIFDKEDFAW